MSATDDGELPAVFESASAYDTHSDRDTDRIRSPRRGLKRISAACQRCRRRKQKVRATTSSRVVDDIMD